MMSKLTNKQKVVLESIEWYLKQFKIPPTIREIAEMTNSSVGTTHAKVLALEEKGYIKTDMNKARTIRVIKGLDDD